MKRLRVALLALLGTTGTWFVGCGGGAHADADLGGLGGMGEDGSGGILGGSANGSGGSGEGGAGDGGSGDGGSATGGAPDAPPETVEDTLGLLGVDITPSPRRAPDGDGDLPPDFAPFGSRARLDVVDELFLVGVPLLDPDNQANTLPGRTLIVEKDIEDDPTTVLDAPANPVWSDENEGENFAQSTRAAVAADVDDDGHDELVVVYVDLDNPSADEELHLVIKEDKDAAVPYEETDVALHVLPNVRDVTVESGDWDGDGLADLAVGVDTTNDGAKLLFFENTGSGFVLASVGEIEFPAAAAGREQTVQLAAGRLDFDAGDELAVVTTEYVPTPGGITNYYVFDDGNQGYDELDSGLVQATDTESGTFSPVVADVAMGDIDGDFLDEILIGGLVEYTSNCDTPDYGAIVLQDRRAGFTKVGDLLDELLYGNLCDQANSWSERWVHVNAVDLDADGTDEMAVNGLIFDDMASAPFSIRHDIGFGALMPDTQSTWFDRSTSVITVGDLSGDGREDLIVYAQNMPQSGPAIRVYGTHQVDGFGLRTSIPTDFENTQNPLSPLIVPANIDDDSPVLRFDEGTYQLVFTEPVILAALAAAPCAEDIGQNTDACGTTFGTATTTTTTVEDVLSVSAGVSVGINIDGSFFTQSQLSIKASFTTTASAMKGSSYAYTQSVVYSTGPLEDSVIFTTIPYDTWTYTVESHPEPDMVGTPYTVALPREPMTLIADLDFFNASLTPDEVPIGTETFEHTPGDLATYPSESDKNALLTTAGGGLETPAQAVGQGTSATEIGLAVGTELTTGNSLEMGFEFEVEATVATVMAGFSVGASTESSLQVTSGTETSYTGSVGSIDAEHFAEHVYSFGLFTYVLEQPGSDQEYQVVNYWVE